MISDDLKKGSPFYPGGGPGKQGLILLNIHSFSEHLHNYETMTMVNKTKDHSVTVPENREKHEHCPNYKKDQMPMSWLMSFFLNDGFSLTLLLSPC